MRVESWPEILNEYIDSSYEIDFEWGRNDCALWVGKYLERVKVSTHYIGFLGRYETELGAKRTLTVNGHDSLESLADYYLSRRDSIHFAQRGDIVYYEKALGLCAGINSFFLMPDKGVVAIDTQLCDIAWRGDKCRQ